MDHVASSVTWTLASQHNIYMVSYRWSIWNDFAWFARYGASKISGHDIDLLGSRDVTGYLTTGHWTASDQGDIVTRTSFHGYVIMFDTSPSICTLYTKCSTSWHQLHFRHKNPKHFSLYYKTDVRKYENIVSVDYDWSLPYLTLPWGEQLLAPSTEAVEVLPSVCSQCNRRLLKPPRDLCEQ